MIVIVPARGGSKGLPGKNLRPLAGRPLIVHTLQSALDCPAVERVIVSTDDDEIIRVCRSVDGVEVPFRRPAHLATDDAVASDAYLHVVDCLAVSEGVACTEICVLLPTSPLRLPSDIDAAIELYRQNGAQAVVSVTEAKPAEWLHNMAEDGRLQPVVASESLDNRQDYEPIYLPNGSIYIFDVETLRHARHYVGPRTFGYPMPAERSVDIDTEADFLAAEALLNNRLRDHEDRDLRRAV
ncbi:MAG: acylneuraminate cytidylyltransferase family protein [Alphaproteobacteria bacterium]|nr:acylneuraminate cytidylyltransferase family protein [Alphaproteobacteria bacterium]